MFNRRFGISLSKHAGYENQNLGYLDKWGLLCVLYGSVVVNYAVWSVVNGRHGLLRGQVGDALRRGVAQGQRFRPGLRRHAVAPTAKSSRVLRINRGGSAGDVL